MRWSTAGGGVVLMNTIHDVDAILWITGLEVDRVQGAIATSSAVGEVEDTALAFVAWTSGALGSIEALASVPGSDGPAVRWINRIYGVDGQILLPTPWGEEGLALFTRRSGEWTEPAPQRRGDPRALAFERFAEAVLAGAEPPVSCVDGVRVAKLVHAVYEAARRGTAIDVPAMADGT
jgi:predicted dehydrogenase